MNEVILIGHIANDTELLPLKNGGVMYSYRVATSDEFSTEYHKVKRFTKTPSPYLEFEPGQQVVVLGKLSTRSYEKQDGSKQWVTEIIARSVKALMKNTSEP